MELLYCIRSLLEKVGLIKTYFQNSDVKKTKALQGGTCIPPPVSLRCKCFIWSSESVCVCVCVCVCFEHLVSVIQKAHIWCTFSSQSNRLRFWAGFCLNFCHLNLHCVSLFSEGLYFLRLFLGVNFLDLFKSHPSHSPVGKPLASYWFKSLLTYISLMAKWQIL